MSVITGKKLAEGKTKEVFAVNDMPGHVLLRSKDRITAHNAARQHDMEGKSAISTETTSKILSYLHRIGIRTHFLRQHDPTSFIARDCHMIPIEWVSRRVATGSFLRRNPGVKEGHRFTPVKVETFYKDDAAGDPEWSREQLLAQEMVCAGREITTDDCDVMAATTACVFEVLEKAWASLDCALIDMKIEFGVDKETGELLLADVIDSDSWRLWPSGDKRLQVDKQVYRDMENVTSEGLNKVKTNFQWVAQQIDQFTRPPVGRVVILMGSASDMAFSRKIEAKVASFHIPCVMRVTSAHKSTEDTLQIMAEVEGAGVPVVYIAVAGRSNGLGPVVSGNSSYPVINCPPNQSDWAGRDVWSSLHLPSGLSCSTILSPESAGQHAAQILSLTNHAVWAQLRVARLNTYINIKHADVKLREESSSAKAADTGAKVNGVDHK